MSGKWGTNFQNSVKVEVLNSESNYLLSNNSSAKSVSRQPGSCVSTPTSGCGGINACSKVMCVVYGICEVIVEGGDVESIG